MYDIRWDRDAKKDMEGLKLRAHEIANIIDTVDDQLTHQAERPSKRKLPVHEHPPRWSMVVATFIAR